MVVKAFFPVLILSLLFFILILQLVDLFANLWRYLNQDVPLITIAEIAWLYLPKCVSFSLPLALLFSVSYTLGTLYSNNELISVFGSGISLYKFISPLIAVGFLLSFINIYFEEKIVIKSFREKNELTNTVLNQKVSYSNTNITVRDNKKNLIYHADYYNDNTGTLSGLIIIELDESGLLKKRIDSEEARWNGKHWELINCRIFSWKDDEGVMIQENKD
ncbi:MAG: YjgP/YjgQ family permease, partial [Spirochaetes bacterium]